MSTNLYSSKQLPNHVAFIMDGNRRWAKKKKLQIIDGHKKGLEVVKSIVRKSLKLKIKYLTFFSFSTENWNRSKLEILNLQTLLKYYLDSEEENFIRKRIKFTFIGDIDKFDSKIKAKLKKLEKITESFNNLFFTLALSYGSRSEIVNSIKKINKDKNDIDEDDISSNLMTGSIPDPDFVIRTSGEKRLSNFLLWQIAYAELYFTRTMWPEFNSQKYNLALKNFINRKRRYGGD